MADQIILSQDGSHTIKSENFGVTYHSKYGAIQETQTVFLNAGLNYALEKNLNVIRILEMGFGTGLNALMTMIQPLQNKTTIHFTTLEAYPIDKNQARSLNYPSELQLSEKLTNKFYEMHSVASGIKRELQTHFHFTKHIIKLENFVSNDLFDVIYYDAFAPTSQEELWTPKMMEKMFGLTSEGGVLVSYCAKGSFKRALKSAGFLVEGLPGPVGKREMTRAIKI